MQGSERVIQDLTALLYSYNNGKQFAIAQDMLVKKAITRVRNYGSEQLGSLGGFIRHGVGWAGVKGSATAGGAAGYRAGLLKTPELNAIMSEPEIVDMIGKGTDERLQPQDLGELKVVLNGQRLTTQIPASPLVPLRARRGSASERQPPQDCRLLLTGGPDRRESRPGVNRTEGPLMARRLLRRAPRQRQSTRQGEGGGGDVLR